jgi:hypothetical protein
MLFRFVIANLITVALGVAHSSAAEGRSAEPASVDPRLIDLEIARLSSDGWKERSDATMFLINAGPAAEMRLRRLVDQTPSPEARIRAQRVLMRICAIRRTEPALITLDLQDADAPTAFAAVAEIEGTALATRPPNLLATTWLRANAHFQGIPYWQAIRELCRQFHLEIHCGETGVELARNDGNAPVTQALVQTGLFLVTGRLTSWSPDQRDPGRSVRLEVYPEPRAQLLRGNLRVRLIEAKDQHGQSLLPLADSGINLGGAGRKGPGYAWNVPLRPVASRDTMLSKLRGIASVVLAEQVQTLELPDRSGGKTLSGPMPVSLSAGAVSASIMSMVSVDDAYRMDMQIGIDPAEMDWEALLISMQNGGIRAFDVDNRELALLNFSTEGGGPADNIRCKWGKPKGSTSAPVGAPFKLIWDVPSRTTEVVVPFELHEVRLGDP